MKKAVILFLVLLFSCQSGLRLHTEIYKGHPILVGKAQLSDLETKPYNEWFDANYRDYRPDNEFINKLKSVIDDYRFTVILGTWCGDSQEQVPALFKVLDAAGYRHPVELYCVPRKYKEYKPVRKYKLIRVPTIIIYKDKFEKGRIIEYPMDRIESDLWQIISTNTYRHELQQN
jgi:hypothetical protein